MVSTHRIEHRHCPCPTRLMVSKAYRGRKILKTNVATGKEIEETSSHLLFESAFNFKHIRSCNLHGSNCTYSAAMRHEVACNCD